MNDKVPKYALIGGREFVLIESIPHVSSSEVACVFEDNPGTRRYVSEAEWLAGAEDCTCEEYYQPVVEDFEIGSWLEDWYRENGFAVVHMLSRIIDNMFQNVKP